MQSTCSSPWTHHSGHLTWVVSISQGSPIAPLNSMLLRGYWGDFSWHVAFSVTGLLEQKGPGEALDFGFWLCKACLTAFQQVRWDSSNWRGRFCFGNHSSLEISLFCRQKALKDEAFFQSSPCSHTVLFGGNLQREAVWGTVRAIIRYRYHQIWVSLFGPRLLNSSAEDFVLWLSTIRSNL